MADIFLSYSQEDRDRVRRIAEALEAAGYSVWWDYRLKPGEYWDEVVEREIDAAACMIVVWTEKSVASRSVRAEAAAGDYKGALLPIRLDAVRPPVRFINIQWEDFVGWDGSTGAAPFRRLILQIDALAGAAEKQKPLQRSHRLALRAAFKSEGEEVARRPRRAPRVSRPKRPASGIGWLFLASALIFSAALFVNAQSFAEALKLTTVTSTIAAALVVFMLFRLADAGLSPQLKAIAGRWLLPVEGDVKVNVGEAFYNLFIAVYGRDHWSWKCLWRSAASSLIFFVMIIAVMVLSRMMTWVELIDFFDESLNGEYIPPWAAVGLLVVIFGFPNLIGDYVSLYETRVLLRIIRKRNSFRWIVALADLPLTAAVYFFCVFIIFFSFAILIFSIDHANMSWTETMDQGSETFRSYVGVVFQNLLDLSKGYRAESTGALLILANFLTTFGTSVWLWLTLVFGPVSSALLWRSGSGATALGRMIDVRERPFTALGVVISIFVLLIGFGVWAAQLAFA